MSSADGAPAHDSEGSPAGSATSSAWSIRTTTGRHFTRPAASRVEQVANALPRGEALVVERSATPAEYTQAWLQPQGLWQLEVHMEADHHWRTITASTDRVVQTLLDWAHKRLPSGDADRWQQDGWQDISGMLA